MSDANFAQDKLGQMPVSHADIANTQKFLTQAADYSYYLIQKHLDGEEITPKYDGNILFNFAYKQDNITIYPDLIKVKVVLDTGEIVGFDASTYYLNHKEKKLGKPAISQEEAREKVKVEFDINSIRLALIPKGKTEVLCYEYKGRYRDGDFIIYINAMDGTEEQILQIIHDENGTLTF